MGRIERRSWRTWVRAHRAGLGLTLRIGVVVVAAVVLLPQLTRLEASGLALASRWWLLPLALCLEAGSLLAYAELVHTVLAAAGQPIARGLMRRATVAGYAVGRTLPGGSMAALAVVTTELRGIGLAPATTAASLAASGVLSAVVLALLLPVAIVLALVGGEGGGVVLSVAGFALLVLAGALVARPTLRKPGAFGRLAERLTRAVARGPLRGRLNPERVGEQVTEAAQSLRDLGREPGVLWRAGGWAAANWLLDLAVLAAITIALGRDVPLWGLPLAYVLGQWTASVPLTPGGVGLVESAMIAALVAAGVPASIATASVLGWRLVSHWLPIVVGLALLPTIRASARRPPPDAGAEPPARQGRPG